MVIIPMNEEKNEHALTKYIGLGILSVSTLLYVILSILYQQNRLSILNLSWEISYALDLTLIFMQVSICVGLFFLFIGSSHKQSGNYLMYMGHQLIIFGILIIIINDYFQNFQDIFYKDMSLFILSNIGNFLLLGFPLGYLSGPLCIILGVLNKKIKDHPLLGAVSLFGLFIFSISFIGLTFISQLFMVYMYPA